MPEPIFDQALGRTSPPDYYFAGGKHDLHILHASRIVLIFILAFSVPGFAPNVVRNV